MGPAPGKVLAILAALHHFLSLLQVLGLLWSKDSSVAHPVLSESCWSGQAAASGIASLEVTPNDRARLLL